MCDCNKTGCDNGSKCKADKYTSELVYDGLVAGCAQLATIIPNCSNLNDVLELLTSSVCSILNGGLNGLDGASYKATSLTSLNLNGVLDSRATVITPIVSVASTGTAYAIGCRVRYASVANPTIDYVEGVVTAFNNNTGAMTFLIDLFGPTASGSHTDWDVSLSGEKGKNGTNGTNGAPGVGGMAYENYYEGVPDVTLLVGETLIPQFDHTITADGQYQIHFNADVFRLNNIDAELRLYIDGVLKILTRPVSNLNSSDVKSSGLTWRGSISIGNLVEIRGINTNAGVSTATILNSQLLINKET